jgi:D-alanine--poly(phosphoribitol) ligase subunit 1
MSDNLDPVSLFYKVANSVPVNTVAVKTSSSAITYQQLSLLVNTICVALLGQPESEKIALLLPQGHKAYASMFASLAAGKYYCPINVEAPSLRIEQIINEFSPDIVLYCDETQDLLTAIHCNNKSINIDEISQVSEKKIVANHKIAYVIFTSGSTGTPKGVVVGRKGLIKYLAWAINALQISPASVVSQHPNIGFDLSVLDIYTTLCSGGTLVPITGLKYRSMPSLAIKDFAITHWISVPSIANLIAKNRQLLPDHFKSLSTILFCGEPLYKHQLDFLFALKPSLLVINTYGPTEATVSCTQVNLTQANYQYYCRGQSVCIGQAISGINLAIVGEHDSGELLISGEQVALGYWQDEAKTRQYFTNLTSTKRSYYSGDIVERIDGKIFFCARNDKQIKLNGFRIELNEIEHVIRELGFDSCISVFHDNQLIAFIESKEKIDTKVLRTNMAKFLPAYMLPHHIQIERVFPRNINDKIDGKQLIENFLNEYN